MAIIRSKIARQLLAEGGVSLDDAKMMAPPGEFLAYINPKEADMLKATGGSGIMTPMGIPSFAEDYGSFDAYGGMDTNTGYESGTAADPMGEAAGTTEMFSGGGGDPFIEASEVAYTGGPKGRQDPFQDSIQGYVTPKQTVLGNIRDSAGDIILGLVAPKAFIAK